MIIGQKVMAYRNLNNGKIALRSMDNKVIGYCDTLVLKACSTKIGKGTQATIKRKFDESGKRDRNVHAFIIGEIVSIDQSIDQINGRNVSYNPFYADFFYFSDNRSEQFNGSNFVAFKAAPKTEKMTSIAF